MTLKLSCADFIRPGRAVQTSALGLLTISFLMPAPARPSAPIREVEKPALIRLRVDGLACPFCAYGLEKKLRALAGVQDVSIDINRGKVVLEVAGSELPDLEAVREAVKKAGFTPGPVAYELIGRVDAERKTFQWRGGDVLLPIRFHEREDTAGIPDPHAFYRVRGVLKRTSDGKMELVIESMEPVSVNGDSSS